MSGLYIGIICIGGCLSGLGVAHNSVLLILAGLVVSAVGATLDSVAAVQLREKVRQEEQQEIKQDLGAGEK
jgi:hypothetical protein